MNIGFLTVNTVLFLQKSSTKEKKMKGHQEGVRIFQVCPRIELIIQYCITLCVGLVPFN